MPSEKPKLTINDVSIKMLAEEHEPMILSFFCSGKEEEDFLKKDALQHQKLRLSKTFLLIEDKNSRLVSYITLSFGSFKISENEQLGGVPIREKQTHIFSSHIPCLLIGKLATDKKEEGRGGGTMLLDFASQIGVKIDDTLPLPFMALHAHPDKAQYYKNRGFSIAFTSAKSAETITLCRKLVE